MKNNLTNKWLVVLATMTLSLTLTWAATPGNDKQNKNKTRQDKMPGAEVNPGKLPQMPTKVALKCAPYNHSDVSAFITITNNTGQPILQGTSVFWQLKGTKGTASVASGGLQPNKSFDLNTGLHWADNGPCAAYYLKK